MAKKKPEMPDIPPVAELMAAEADRVKEVPYYNGKNTAMLRSASMDGIQQIITSPLRGLDPVDTIAFNLLCAFRAGYRYGQEEAMRAMLMG